MLAMERKTGQIKEEEFLELAKEKVVQRGNRHMNIKCQKRRCGKMLEPGKLDECNTDCDV